jgi:hypothetical protein
MGSLAEPWLNLGRGGAGHTRRRLVTWTQLISTTAWPCSALSGPEYVTTVLNAKEAASIS